MTNDEAVLADELETLAEIEDDAWREDQRRVCEAIARANHWARMTRFVPYNEVFPEK